MDNDKYSNALEIDEKCLKLTSEMQLHIRHHINNDLAVIAMSVAVMSKNNKIDSNRVENIEKRIKKISKYLLNIEEFVEENHEN